MAGLEWSDTPAAGLSVNGAALEYACFGPPPGKAATIVMLHEGLGCLALWRDFPRQIAAATGMGVFVYSRQGYGGSDPVHLPRPLDFMTREAEDVLPLLLDRIGFRRGMLLGHSDGATIAAIYAGSVADHRVRGLILMAPHFFTEPSGLAEIGRAAQAFESGDLKARMAKYHRHPEIAFRGWSGAWLAPAFATWNVADVIAYFRVPVLAIQGSDDRYGTLAQIDEIEERAYAPVDRLILEGCGHAPHLERPEQVLEALAAFAARLERIEAASVETA